jgi:sporadic carbohydrate cluster 2OG-Fe(II) oxygenase
MFQDQAAELLKNGFTQFRFGDAGFIDSLSRELKNLAATRLGGPVESLELVHESLGDQSLNSLRVDAIQTLNRNREFRDHLLENARPLLEKILGPDLAVQKNISLVISTPGDDTSQIPLHADTWTGHSLFELNLWIPLTRVFKTQSMFILPLERMVARKNEWDGKDGSIDQLMTKWKTDLHFIDANPGEAILFWHHLPHGNTVNLEKHTRWSLNLRFKNLFSPYGDKGLGDYFVPWKYGALTELALQNGKIWL